jgi:hypothetical protein
LPVCGQLWHCLGQNVLKDVLGHAHSREFEKLRVAHLSLFPLALFRQVPPFGPACRLEEGATDDALDCDHGCSYGKPWFRVTVSHVSALRR